MISFHGNGNDWFTYTNITQVRAQDDPVVAACETDLLADAVAKMAMRENNHFIYGRGTGIVL